MNIIIGITNSNITMKIKFIYGVFLFALIASCTNKQPKNKNFINTKSDVEVVNPIVKNLNVWQTFQGVTKYLNTSTIKSPITGIIQKVNVSVGQNVEKNTLLFTIKPKELAALEQSNLDKNLINIAPVTIKAHQSNFITGVNFQVGDYVQEGDVLATNVKKSSLVVIAYIPFNVEVKQNVSCEIKLSDNIVIKGIIEKKLTQADLYNQKQPYVVRIKDFKFLAENINVTARLLNREIKDGLFVPKKALFANEEETNFWVMKMINDTTSVKHPVKIGFQNDSLIEIFDKSLNARDKIITNGGYGLSDTAFVHIVAPKKLK